MKPEGRLLDIVSVPLFILPRIITMIFSITYILVGCTLILSRAACLAELKKKEEEERSAAVYYLCILVYWFSLTITAMMTWVIITSVLLT